MNTVCFIFLIMGTGYLLGGIRFFGLTLGTSGVLLTGLVFGHFGVVIPEIVRNFGLALFVGSVGLIAGPVFFGNLKKSLRSYLLISLTLIGVGASVAFLLCKAFCVPADIGIGVFSGAMTSTPGLAAALEATGSDMASVGYGIAYPFGVVGAVLFVQLFPRVTRMDVEREVCDLRWELQQSTESQGDGIRCSDYTAMVLFSLTMAAGLLLAQIQVPLPNGLKFSLGIAGGPLFAGLLVGHLARKGRLPGSIPGQLLKHLRELGLCLFLMGAGTDAGRGFVGVLRIYGVGLFGIGFAITLIPLICTSLLTICVLKMNKLTALGSICGGRTCTPSLGALISVCKTEDVAVAYAATYPFSLITIVVVCQLMAMFW